MYKIGEFSKIVDIPIRTLRYYDEYGLLCPKKIDDIQLVVHKEKENISSVMGEYTFEEEIMSANNDINILEWQNQLDNNGYVKGIDISLHQRDMDLDKVLKENDIKFVMARMAYFWEHDTVDSVFYEQAKICSENNVALGVYFWPTLKNVATAEKELDLILAALDDIREKEGIYLDMPICLDIENKNDGGYDLVERILNNDSNTLEAMNYTIERLKEENYYTMIYCSDNVSQELGNKLNNLDLDVWVSKYYTNKKIDFNDNEAVVQARKYDGVSTMRQYSQSGDVKGYTGDIDLDLCYYNLPKIIRDANLNHHNEKEKLLKKQY